MLFEQRYREAIATGAVTLTFRRWRRGRWWPGTATAPPRDGSRSRRWTSWSPRRSPTPRPDGREPIRRRRWWRIRGPDDLPLYRVRFHAVAEPDPRDELAATADLSADEVAEPDRQLDRLDGPASHGPWTAETLALIAARPAVRAVTWPIRWAGDGSRSSSTSAS
jgi:hypothetical protein